MRRTTPKLILQGNQREAKKWIPWATKALKRIKDLTVEGFANKVFRPVTGVAVHVRSVNDIDRIRIAVLQKVGCSNSIELVEARAAFHEVDLLSKHFVNKKRLWPAFAQGWWAFGDGTTSSNAKLNDVIQQHSYDDAGD